MADRKIRIRGFDDRTRSDSPDASAILELQGSDFTDARGRTNDFHAAVGNIEVY